MVCGTSSVIRLMSSSSPASMMNAAEGNPSSAGGRASTMRTRPSSSSSVAETCQAEMRATPCEGLEASCGCLPNQGQQSGTPPRRAFPRRYTTCGLVKITGCCPLGAQLITCAPYTDTIAVHSGVSTRMMGNSSP